MGPKPGSPGAALQFLKSHFKHFPEEAPAIMLAVQAGSFAVHRNVKGANDFLSDYKKIDKVTDESMIALIMEWVPGLTRTIVAKMQKAEYATGKKDDKILSKLFMYMTCSSENENLPTRSKKLLVQLFEQKRDIFKAAPKLQLTTAHLVKLQTTGVYKLVGEEPSDAGESELFFKRIQHSFLGIEVSLPKTLVCIKGQAYIDKNWDEKLAVLTNKDGDFVKIAYGLFPVAAMQPHQMSTLVKAEPMRTKLRQATDDLSEIEEAKAAQSTVGEENITPAKKRRLCRTISEGSVPDDLKAEESRAGV